MFWKRQNRGSSSWMVPCASLQGQDGIASLFRLTDPWLIVYAPGGETELMTMSPPVLSLRALSLALLRLKGRQCAEGLSRRGLCWPPFLLENDSVWGPHLKLPLSLTPGQRVPRRDRGLAAVADGHGEASLSLQASGRFTGNSQGAA
ncbi:hypothetical protein Cadr_000021667 [Camelus dromedarius]|uniref:Uncharacterized protein n=1 Tax=Camelus dromedarius TaxID=9838 RepID=A0A5N4CRD6_CAMDR|nr:hypothetical protein Cadr_000021667 [Camelus dromedarius]